MTSVKRNTSKEATQSFSERGILFKSRVRELGGTNASSKEKVSGSSSKNSGSSKKSASAAPLQKAAAAGGASLVFKTIRDGVMREKGLGEWALIAGSAAAVVSLAFRRKRAGGRALEVEPDRKRPQGERSADLQQILEAGQQPKGVGALSASMAAGERVQILLIEPGTPDCGEALDLNGTPRSSQGIVRHDPNGTPRSSQGIISHGGLSPRLSPLLQITNTEDSQAIRKMVHKLRHQLRNRDEMMLEMQAQMTEQERELEEERVRVVDLETKLELTEQTRLELERENQRLTKEASTSVSESQNGSNQADEYELMSLSDEAHRLRQQLKEKERMLLEKQRAEAMLRKREQELEGNLRALEEQVVAKDRLIMGYEQERLQLNTALAALTAQAAQAVRLNSQGKSLSSEEDDLMALREERDFAEPLVRERSGSDWLSPTPTNPSPFFPAPDKAQDNVGASPDDSSLWSHETRSPFPAQSGVGSCDKQKGGLPKTSEKVELENGSALSASRDADVAFGSETPRERLEGRFNDNEDGDDDMWLSPKAPGSVLREELEYLKSDLKSRYELIAEKRREEDRLLSNLDNRGDNRSIQEVRNSMAVHPEDDSDLEHAWEQFAEGMSLMQYNGSTPSDPDSQGQMHILQTRLEQVAIEQRVNQEMHEISRREARINELRSRITSATKIPPTGDRGHDNGSGNGSSNAVSPSVGPLGSVGTPSHSTSSDATPRRRESLGQELSQKLAEMEEQKHKSSRDLRQLALSLHQSSPTVAEGRKDILGKPRSDGVPLPLPRQPLYDGTAVNTADPAHSYARDQGDAEGQENRGPQPSSNEPVSPVPFARQQRKRSLTGLNGRAEEMATDGSGEEPWEVDDELVRLTAEFELEAADDPTDVMIGSPTSSPANSLSPFDQQQSVSPEPQASGNINGESAHLTKGGGGSVPSDSPPEYESDPPLDESPPEYESDPPLNDSPPEYESDPLLDESPEERGPPQRNWQPSLAAISNGSGLAWNTPQTSAMGSPAQSWAVMSPAPSPLKGQVILDAVRNRDFSPSVVCMGSPVLNDLDHDTTASLRTDTRAHHLQGHAGLDAVPEENTTPPRTRRFPDDAQQQQQQQQHSSRYSTPASHRRTANRRDGGTMWDSEGDVMLDEMLNGALDDMVRACSTPGSSADPSPAQSMEFRNS